MSAASDHFDKDIKPERVGVVVIHGVGEAEPGWINDYIVDELKKREPELDFDRHSEVYRLYESGSGKKPVSAEVPREKNYFLSVMRTARLGRRSEVSFTELHWADISKVGSSMLERSLTWTKLFFEAPHIIGNSLLQESTSGVHGVIRRLVLVVLWLLRWPIAGLQLAIFGSAFLYVIAFEAFKLLGVPNWLESLGYPTGHAATISLPLIVIGLLLITAISGLLFARDRARSQKGLTSLGLTTTVFSVILIGLIVLFGFVVDLSDTVWGASAIVQLLGGNEKVIHNIRDFSAADAGRVETYLALGGWIIIGVWALWNFAMVSAVLLIGVIGIFRIMRPPQDGHFPLSRPACAAALAILQGIVWKLIICPLSLFVIVVLAGDEIKAVQDAGKSVPWAINGFFSVYDILVRMLIISFMNLIVSGAVAIALHRLMGERAQTCQIQQQSLMGGTATVPRLIVNNSLLGFILLCNLATVTIYYFVMPSEGETFRWVSGLVKDFGAVDFLTGLVSGSSLGTLVLYLISALQEVTNGVLHIARDIVDHQYTPRLSHVDRLLPKSVRARGHYPRRARMENRLDVLMTEVVLPRKFDRLVFLTHSQGTVIMHDYLRSDRSKVALSGFKRVDVITLASPLSHLYGHYFADYSKAAEQADLLHPKLSSWTNLWRIDDPIGHQVGVIDGGFIVNKPLPAGGHVNYWKEDEVCAVILHKISPAAAPADGAVSDDNARPTGPRVRLFAEIRA